MTQHLRTHVTRSRSNVLALALLSAGCSAHDLAEGRFVDDLADKDLSGIAVYNIKLVDTTNADLCIGIDTTKPIDDGYQAKAVSCNERGKYTLDWARDCDGRRCRYIATQAKFGSLCLEANASTTTVDTDRKLIYAKKCSSRNVNRSWGLPNSRDPFSPHKIAPVGTPAFRIQVDGYNDLGLMTCRDRQCGSRFTLVAPLSRDVTYAGPTVETPADDYPTVAATSPTTSPPTTSITHVGTETVWDHDGKQVQVNLPRNVREGDLLVLFLYRTDHFIPIAVDGWNYATGCYKHDNNFDCSAYSPNTCIPNGNPHFCNRFPATIDGQSQGDLQSRDLGQSIFWRKAEADEPATYTFQFNPDSIEYDHAAWIILTAWRGADTTDPIRDSATIGKQKALDVTFPSVAAQPGDMILMSEAFDDDVADDVFGTPAGAKRYGFVSKEDETGMVFGRLYTSEKEPEDAYVSRVKTSPDPGSKDDEQFDYLVTDQAQKDAIVTIAIKPAR